MKSITETYNYQDGNITLAFSFTGSEEKRLDEKKRFVLLLTQSANDLFTESAKVGTKKKKL